MPTPAHMTPLANPKPVEATASLLNGLEYPNSNRMENRMEIMPIDKAVIDDETVRKIYDPKGTPKTAGTMSGKTRDGNM